MMSAFILSAVFFGVLCDFKVVNAPTPYGGEGWLRPTYFFILVSHIILSIPVLPLALLGFKRSYWRIPKACKNRKMDISYIWMYVAITGVLVYIFAMPYYA